jgi:DMSO/TMAO reductase YedYZ molybdopterin-dependent catalytic subunit
MAVDLSSRFRSELRDERTAAILGLALGVSFSVCFVTGVLSHLIQNPGGWFSWPARPAGLYRFTQGLHVATGIASIPLLLAKLWVVFPKLFEWPPVRSVGHAVERAALLPLIGGSLLLLLTGLGNINIYRPYNFSFRSGHYAAAWIVIGGLVVHVGAKWVTIKRGLRPGGHGGDAAAISARAQPAGLDRRGFLLATFATAGLLTAVTVGQTLRPLRRLAVLAPRRPDVGPQGFPVNRLAVSVGLTHVDLDAYRLVVDGPGVKTPLSLTYDELRAMPQHEATLAIACVEGWSTSQRWRGVRVADLLERAGAEPGSEALVHALHRNTRQRTSPLSAGQARDRDTLLALEVNGERLHPDHGFPVRLIGPNRPGVHQTKWVGQLEVLA